MHALPADGGGAAAAEGSDYPVPPDWIIPDPEENKRHVLALLERGEQDIAAGRTVDGAEVQRRVRERILARKDTGTSR